MRDETVAVRPDLVDLATEVVGEDPFQRADEGTEFQQPAIFCASLAGWESLRHSEPVALAGHSLGELTALTAAGAIAEPDALRLVAARGRLMAEAAEVSGETTMLAVKSGRDGVQSLLEPLGLTLANDNAPKQVVLAGPVEAISKAAEQLREKGIRSVPLPVAGAFHSPAMAPAAEGLADQVAATAIGEPRIPVYSCLSAAPFEDIAAALVDSLTRPVRWLETLQALQAAGVTRFVETGPNRVLTGLVGRSLKGVEAESLADKEPAGAA